MGSDANQPPLIVIVGQTASGKSALALELAQQFRGEIICADSKTVYRSMDIGTAKPSKKEQQLARHHLLDIANPDEPMTAAVYKQRAQAAIDDVASRGHTPFLVGGTGLYIDAVLFDFSFKASAPGKYGREELSAKSTEELRQLLVTEGIPLPSDSNNPRRLMRQLETGGAPATKSSLRSNSLVLGMPLLDREILQQRLTSRLEQMFAEGLEDEVKRLSGTFGWDCPALQTIGYQEFRLYFSGQQSLADAKAAIVQHSLQYAKRQKTWFKRNPHIHWICKKEDAVDLITSLLNKNYIGEHPSLLQYKHD